MRALGVRPSPRRERRRGSSEFRLENGPGRQALCRISHVRSVSLLLSSRGDIPERNAPGMIRRDNQNGVRSQRGLRDGLPEFTERFIGEREIVEIVSTSAQLMFVAVVDAGWMGDGHVDEDEVQLAVADQASGMLHDCLVVVSIARRMIGRGPDAVRRQDP